MAVKKKTKANAKKVTAKRAGAPAKPPAKAKASARVNIEERLRDLGDWRADVLARVRRLIREAEPEIVEEWKWAKATSPGVPVWSRGGGICTGESYKEIVKLTFFRGASLPDPAGLFNSSLGGSTRRAIDIREKDAVDEGAFRNLIRAAVALNLAKGSGASAPKLLSGGNPQIAKADGEAPVQAYIAAMPGWKSEAGSKLDALITRTVPGVRKAVKWNSPFYGVEGQGWFLSYHCFTKYIKVVFFRGSSLKPVPPVSSKDPHARYFHIHEGERLDEHQVADWIRQASAVPGWIP